MLFTEHPIGAVFDYYTTRGWDVAPDGQRFLVALRDTESRGNLNRTGFSGDCFS